MEKYKNAAFSGTYSSSQRRGLASEASSLEERQYQTIAVVGPGADEPALGDYCTDFDKSHMVTVLEGIRRLAGEGRTVLYAEGCSYLGESIRPFPPAWLVDESGNPGLTGRYYNGWEMQGEPVVVRKEAASTGTPVVLVLQNGRPLSLEWHVEPGDFQVMVGDNAANVLLTGQFTIR